MLAVGLLEQLLGLEATLGVVHGHQGEVLGGTAGGKVVAPAEVELMIVVLAHGKEARQVQGRGGLLP